MPARGRLQSALAVLAAPCLCLAGCSTGPPDAEGWEGRADTLASGAIVVTNPDQPLWSDEDRRVLRERWRRGALEGEGPDVFGDVRDLELGPDGTLYVLEGQAAEVRVFGPDGAWRRTVGREGEGPGELNVPAGITLSPDDDLWVMNWRNARFTVFDPVTGETLREPRRLASFTAFPWPGRFDDRGRLVDMGLTVGQEPALIRLDSEFVPADTLRLPEPDPDHRIRFYRGETLAMATNDPFAPYPRWAVRPVGGYVVGEGGSLRFHRVGFDGDTSRTFVIEREPAAVTAAERDSALDAFRRNLEVHGNLRAEREPRVPARKPAHQNLFIDDQDRTWIEAYAARGEREHWHVLGSDGRYLGRVDIPSMEGRNASVLAIRGGRVAIAAQPSGVPTVIVYDIVRAGDVPPH